MPAPIPLVPAPTPPRLPGTVIVRPTVEPLIDALAADLFTHAVNCVRTFGDFQLALSGGSTPLPLYQRLMIDPHYREFPWPRTHLWIVDERRVPFEDDRSNFKHIDETIVQHSGIPATQVHPIRATRDDADTDYEHTLREVLGWREKGHDRLDFALLGMGADAHTASLFPFSPALDAGERLVVINSGPRVTPPDRVTMTAHLLNATRFVAVLVTGGGKRETIARIAGGQATPIDAPILAIRPHGGELRWYLDAAACPS